MKQAEAKKKRLAEGIEAEHAALGLAEARVRQATAEAEKKKGLSTSQYHSETAVGTSAWLERKRL